MNFPIRIACVAFLILSVCAAQKGPSEDTASEVFVEEAQQRSRPFYWQQKVDYTMSVKMDVKTFRFEGTQQLIYKNNSPDTLRQVFYHLYFNAFQPNSEMDARSRELPDPDKRVKARIAGLSSDEIGYLKIQKLTQDGKETTHHVEGTILEVQLPKAILPGSSTTFSMEFEGQVPVQIRRSGRDNKEDVALSMTQWYPKMAEYDFEGWHADPYIAREFHGVWGDYDVTITIDREYTIGGTGYLKNAQQIGHGYEDPKKILNVPNTKELSWHFVAPDVHDFAWTADPDYVHDILEVPDGPILHFLYKDDPKMKDNWKALQPKASEVMQYLSEYVGKYPYKQYSILQGGDGGMEYAMCTLITGRRPFGSLVGVTVHEMSHSWFQHILATNESKHAWMDEGFTTFISSLCMNEIMGKKQENPFKRTYASYFGLVKSGLEQPQTTHSDRYAYNRAYGASAYGKGSIFLSQLGYIIGWEHLMETLKRYYSDFKFTHPTPNDFKRTAEKVSGIQLDWYLTDWTQTTNTVNYGISGVNEKEGQTEVTLERFDLMPMPVDLLVTYEDGKRESFYIPLRMMRGEKPDPDPDIKRTVLPDWAWAYPTYKFTIETPKEHIVKIQIDPSGLMANVNFWNKSYNKE